MLNTDICKVSCANIGLFFSRTLIWNPTYRPHRKAKNIKSRVAPSRLKMPPPPPSKTFFDIKGMYQCRKPQCLTCKHVKHGQKGFNHKDKQYTFLAFYTCSTEFVVYCLSCPCGLLYVGRTIRTLRKRERGRKTQERGRKGPWRPWCSPAFFPTSWSMLWRLVCMDFGGYSIILASWWTLQRPLWKRDILDLLLGHPHAQRNEWEYRG